VTSEVINASTSPVTINPSNGLASITKNGTGDFTLALQDPYVRLLDFQAVGVSDGINPPTPISVAVTVDDVASQNSPALSFYTVAPSYDAGPPVVVSDQPADPGDGIVLVTITLANSTAL
jgi:hypothetical protein